MKMNNVVCLALAVIAVMFFSAPAIYAEDASTGTQVQAAPQDGNKEGGECPQMDEAKMAEHKKRMEEHFNKMASEIGLTADQKAALDKDREEFMVKSKDLKTKMKAAKKSLKEELDKAATDEAKVAGIVKELTDLSAQQIQYRVDKVMAMKKVLTPEQFTKMQESMKKHKGEMKGKRGMRPPHDEGAEGPGGSEM